MKLPLIFDIKTFAVHDGPGIRTTFFLKGCPLHCKWCQNPESISPAQYLAYNPLLCQHCGACRSVCPKLGEDFMLERADCTLCGHCVEVCLPAARKFAGRELPLLYDLKKIDPKLHREYTGKDNHQILENLRFLCSHGKEVIIRVPLIPGYTDSQEDIHAIARFIKEELGGAVRRVELLPYNKLAESKYTNNTAYRDGGLCYPLGSLTAQTNEYVSSLARIFEPYGIPAFSEVL